MHPIPFRSERSGELCLGSERVVAHGLAYHQALNQLLADADPAWGRELAAAAATVAGFRLAAAYGESEPLWKRLPTTAIEELARGLGFGEIEVDARLEDGETTRFRATSSTLALRPLLSGDEPLPSCATLGGLVTGALAAVDARPPTRLSVRETACVATGAEECEFEVRCTPPAGGRVPLPPNRESTLHGESGPAGCPHPEAARLREAALPLSFAPRLAGGLGDCGEELLVLPSNYYASLASAWLHRVTDGGRDGGGVAAAQCRLESVARAGTRTFFTGFLQSPAWQAAVEPLLGEDSAPGLRARAALALLGGLGWGEWRPLSEDATEIAVRFGFESLVQTGAGLGGPACFFVRAAQVSLLESCGVAHPGEEWFSLEDVRAEQRDFCVFQASPGAAFSPIEGAA